ncbi:unnamed protein product [Ectocarpus sp. 6 AP-2014]
MGGFMDSIKASCTKMAKQQINEAMAGDKKESASGGGSAATGTRAPEDAEAYAKKVAEAIKADVRMFSGCMDSQTSADVKDVSKFGLPDADGAGGACTNAMLLTLSDEHSDSWLGLLKGMQSVLKTKRFSQVPQLSTSREIDVNDKFSLRNTAGGGSTKCLLIGINYIGQQGELAGCHNDVDMMKKYITTHGYSMDPAACKVLMDDNVHGMPDHKGVIEGFRWLTADAKAGDSLFMHYSGHGGSVKDTSGDEADNMDETLVPVDYKSSGQITDDEILKELVMVLPEGVTLTVVMDCCHSGSILDLPYALKADEGTISAVEAGEVSSTISANPGFDFAKMMAIGKELFSMFQKGKMDMNGVMKIGKLAMS